MKKMIVSLVAAVAFVLSSTGPADARVSEPRPEPNGVQIYKEFTTPAGLACMAAKNQGERRGYLNCVNPKGKDVVRRLPNIQNNTARTVGYYFTNGEGVIKFRGRTY